MMQRRTLWLIVGIAGGALGMLGLGGGLLALALTVVGGSTLTAAESLPLAGIMAFGLVLGIPLALHGWAGWQERPSRLFNPSHVGWLWLLLVLLIGLGTAVSALSLTPVLLLPPIHVLTMALPPLIILCLVGQALRGLGGSWREVIASMASGGSLGMGASFVSEVLIGFALVVIATVVTLITPGGVERIMALAENLEDPTWQEDLTNLFELLLSPTVAISLLGVFSIPVPLVEEIFKTLVTGVVARWVRPHPARAFLWGVASGAGFALVENLFNGALGGAEGWGVGVISRFGATVMHCVTGGLVGWGWGQLWTARRPLRLLGSYVAAVTVHGLWNTAAVGAVLLSAGAWVHVHKGNELWLAPMGLGLLMLVGTLSLLTVAFLIALPFVGRRLASEVERTPDGVTGSEEVSNSLSSEVLIP